MMPFPIWEKDAVLLGRALEEYLQAVDDSEVYFLDFLWSRLSPFYPPINFRTKSERIDASDVPHDVAWELAAENLVRIGFAPRLPNSYFLGLGEASQIACMTVDKPVRHLMDEVAELVAECTARNPLDDANFNVPLDVPWGQVQQRGLAYFFNGSGRSRSGSDDSEKIERLLEELVAQPDNNCGEFFRVGRTVGLILAHCHRYERNFLWELFRAYGAGEDIEVHEQRMVRFDQHQHKEGFTSLSAESWRSFLSATVQELLEDPMLGNSSSAATWLSIEQAKLDEEYDPGDLPTEFRKLATIRSATWLAFGEILHAAQCAEELRPGHDRPRIPRRPPDALCQFACKRPALC
jgi:hypothetical protein